jgi:hypothetical protein
MSLIKVYLGSATIAQSFTKLRKWLGSKLEQLKVVKLKDTKQTENET